MLRSLNSGVTGLINHQTRMDVIGNNISNVNTIGFKNRRATFAESFSQLVKGASKSASKAGGTNPMQIGLGVKVSAVDTIVTQGNLQNTGRIFDIGIEGNAFFGVSDGVGTFYTRNGAFQLDSEGYIVLPTNGMVLQGKMADSYGNFPIGTAIGNMKIPMNQQAPAKETTEVSLARNLPQDADAKGNIIYSQRFLHQVDDARLPSANGITDPGRATSPALASLFDSKGNAFNMKDGDVLTFTWTDMPSAEAVGANTYEISFTVKKPEAPDQDWLLPGSGTGDPSLHDSTDTWTGNLNNQPNYVWSLQSLLTALGQVMSDPATLSNTGNASAADVSFELDARGRIQATNAAGGVTGTTPDPGNVFALSMKSSNPLSGYAQQAFNFGSYLGATDYSTSANSGVYTAGPKYTGIILRPAEQFDYIGNLRDATGLTLGLEPGDPIDVFGSIGSTSIENSKSSALQYWGTTLTTIDPVTNETYTVTTAGMLFDDFLAKVRTDFQLPPTYTDRDGTSYQSVAINGINDDENMPYGAIVIRSRPGEAFAVKDVSIKAKNQNNNDISPTNFNNNLGFLQKRAAVDPAIIDTSIEVYDEGGTPHTITFTFVHTGRAGEWEWKASVDGHQYVTPGTGSGTIFFGQDNTVSSFQFDAGGSELLIDPRNGSSLMRIKLAAGGPGDFRGLTQFNADASVQAIGQNGFGTGQLVEVSIDEFGLIEGAFSNGVNRAIGQIMLVDFANPGGLLDLSDCIFTTSANSGDAVWGKPISQSSSKLKPGALEMSNVDLGTEFTNMITTQRGYQANSRIVTVSDSMLEELVNLKR